MLLKAMKELLLTLFILNNAMRKLFIILIAIMCLLTGCKPRHKRDSIGLEYLQETDFLQQLMLQEKF